MIEAEGLTKHYGAKHAVEQFELHGSPGVRHRFPRTERVGKVDDHANDHGFGLADRR